MRQRFANFLGSPTEFLKNPHNQKLIVVSAFVILFSCLLFLLFGRATQRSETVSAEATTVTLPSTTTTLTPTKWWIRKTATSPSTSSSTPTPSTDMVGMSVSDCPSSFSSPLQSGVYAYISLAPALPNRIRSGPGKAYSYLGQIEPGDGVRVLNGPLCADGFSWWLVESTQAELRGWTAEGRESEQWVIPCPHQKVACNKTPEPKLASPSTSPSSSRETGENKYNKCKSEKLAVGFLAQVEKGNLLVVRSEPNTGDVVGRAGPLSAVNIVDGPACAGGAVWFKVNIPTLKLTGWAGENNLHTCFKEDRCD